jgi:Rieske Fe-S protein
MLRKPDRDSATPDGKPQSQQPQWRRDFPIDVAQDNHVIRRDFMKFLVLISGAFAAGQVFLGLHNLVRRRQGKPPTKLVAALKDIPEGETIQFFYPDQHSPCLLVRSSENKFHAYSQICSHLSCAVQPDMKDRKFRCPCHDGIFDMDSGRVLSGPPRRPLAKINITIKKDLVYATGVEERI